MEFHIVHMSKTGIKNSEVALPAGGIVFETCLRRIVFFSSEQFLSQAVNQTWLQNNSFKFEIFKSETAYRFILEVICGLHSLIKGETEIFGQFKDFFSTHKTEIDANGMTDVFKQLLVDCKFKRLRMNIAKN